MKKITVIILFILTFPMVAHAGEARGWTRKEKVLALTYTALTVVDYLQTSQFEDDGVAEANPLMQDRNGSPDMGKVALIKGGVLVGVLLAAHYAPRYRSGILWFAVIGQGAVVGWNTQF